MATPGRPHAVYAEVRSRIVSGALAPGAPVRQEALAAELGVSKIPLREALARLERDGLLTLNPNRGFEVAPLGRADLEEVFDLRLRLEPAAAARGAELAGEAARSAATAALADLDLALAAGDAAASELNREFHLALVRPGARGFTTALIERLHVMAERHVRAQLRPEGRAGRARREHRRLTQAWLAREGAAVEELLRDHIGGVLQDLRGRPG